MMNPSSVRSENLIQRLAVLGEVRELVREHARRHQRQSREYRALAKVENDIADLELATQRTLR